MGRPGGRPDAMLYRENGQFKTSYRADQQIFPIRQDRFAIAILLLVAFVGVPLVASEYVFQALLIPKVIQLFSRSPVYLALEYFGRDKTLKQLP